MGTAIKHPVPDRVKSSFVFLTSGHSDPQGSAWECPDVKNYKWRLNPVWHRMIYSCTHTATVGIKGLTQYRLIDWLIDWWLVMCCICYWWLLKWFSDGLKLSFYVSYSKSSIMWLISYWVVCFQQYFCLVQFLSYSDFSAENCRQIFHILIRWLALCHIAAFD